MHARRLVALAVVVVVFATGVTSCGGNNEKGGNELSGTFVGPASDSKTYVAIAIASTGGSTARQEVTAYVCDGDSVSNWFVAPKAENKLDLVSQREPFTTKGTATLTAELSSGKATGTVRQSKGEGVDFTAARATGPAGIYSVTALPSGKLTGGSTSGARVEGKLDGGTPANRLDATITTPNGKKYQLRGELGPGLGYNQPDRAVKLRWLVAQDGTIRGAVSRSKPGISVTVDTFD